MTLNRFSPVLPSSPSNLAFPPPTRKARIPALTFCTTWAWAPGVWLKCRALLPAIPPPPRQYPPAERGKAPPVRLGRRVEAKGTTPRFAMVLLILETGNEERSYRPRTLKVDFDERLRIVVENQRCCKRDCLSKAKGCIG